MSVPRVVIDTNIIVSALRSQRGASALLLSMLGRGLFEVDISVPLALEYEDVLLRKRDELGLSANDVVELVDSLCAVARRHDRIYFKWWPMLPDERDEHILDLAVKAPVSYTHLMADTGELDQVLAEGAARAREISQPKVDEMKRIMGLVAASVHPTF